MGCRSMAMDDAGGSRRQTIATAIARELERQGGDGAPGVDIEALADAIDLAIDTPPPADEGKRPEELNATNDD